MSNRRTLGNYLSPNALKDSGGARVYKDIKHKTGVWKAGTILSLSELNSIAPANLRALITAGSIGVFPKQDIPTSQRTPRDEDAKLHIVSKGFGKFDVLEGKILNAKDLTKEEATAFKEERESQPPSKPSETLTPTSPLSNISA